MLSKGMYLLTDVDGHQWLYPKGRHGMPPNGLLVVREVCNPETDNKPYNPNVYESSWHGNSAIPWADLTGPQEIDIILPPVIPARSASQVTFDILESSKRAYPPIEFLRYLKHLSRLTGSSITYYHHESGGNGIYEQEFAWTFGNEDKVYVLYGYDYILEYSNEVTKQLPSLVNGIRQSALMVVLRQYGLKLPTHYFAPHTRNFNWNKYRIS